MCDGLFRNDRNDRNDRVCYKNEGAILFLHLLTEVYKHLPSVNGSMAHSAFLYLIDSSKVSSIIRLEGIWSKRVFWMHSEIPLHLPFRQTLRRTSQSKVFPITHITHICPYLLLGRTHLAYISRFINICLPEGSCRAILSLSFSCCLGCRGGYVRVFDFLCPYTRTLEYAFTCRHPAKIRIAWALWRPSIAWARQKKSERECKAPHRVVYFRRPHFSVIFLSRSRRRPGESKYWKYTRSVRVARFGSSLHTGWKVGGFNFNI